MVGQLLPGPSRRDQARFRAATPPTLHLSATSPWPPAAPFERSGPNLSSLPPGIQVEPAEGSFDVTFSLPSTVQAEKVHLAGSFNGWNAEGLGMRRDADGQWRVRLRLGAGIHSYKFVLGGKEWIRDERNPDTEPDGLDAENSVLRLGALGRPEELLERMQSGALVAEACEHDPGLALFLQRAGEGRALVRYRALSGDVHGIELFLRDQDGLELQWVGGVGPFAYWQVEIALPDAPVDYAFVLRDGDARWSDPEVFRLDPASLPGLQTPEWAKHATWYQVFVDRFRNGRPEIDPDPVRPWRSEWYAPSPWEEASGESFYEYYVFARLYGGDLHGLRDRLDYIQSLGVTALYLNPVFQASTAHKYNATDFRHIDTRYGAGEDYAEATADEDLADPSTWVWTPSDQVFLDFIEECHRRGLKVVLDGVFNHVGTRHPGFQDVVQHGRESRFSDWFEIANWEPFEHVGWAGFSELPVFAKSPSGFACDAVRDHIFAITRRWMDPGGDGDVSRGIDGWRLDVPMEVAMPFWEEWRKLVKSINPDAYLTGEVWDRADIWLDGSTFDAVMNYRFTQGVVGWIGQGRNSIPPSELDQTLAELRLAYPAEATLALMNLADSHDTDRLASMLQNPDRVFDRDCREQNSSTYDAGRPSDLAFRRARLVALFQFTYVGAPMVYYGDEAGMWGSDDPNNRKPMLWEDLQPYEQPEVHFVHGEHLAHYRAIGAMRQNHRCLRTGSYATLFADDQRQIFAFYREEGGEEAVVVLNASDDVHQIELEQLEQPGWRSVFDVDVDPAGREIAPVSGRVWIRDSKGADQG